jgi:hypothetical protein
MDKILSRIVSQILPKLLVLFFLGSTMATTGVAGVRLLNKNQQTSMQAQTTAPKVNDDTEEPDPKTTMTPTGTPRPTQTAGGSVRLATTQNTQITTTPLPTAVPLAISNIKPQAAVNANACIIMLFGKQYDVAPLRSTHPGGDVFTCNTDMSMVYQKQHGTDVSRMQPYLITSTGGGAGLSKTGSTGSTGQVGVTISSQGQTSITRSDDHETDTESEDETDRYTENQDR